MKFSSLNFFLVLVVLALASILGGCSGGGSIRGDALAPIATPILNRHDNYVANDTGLSQVEKDTALRSSAIMRDMIQAATTPAKLEPAPTDQ